MMKQRSFTQHISLILFSTLVISSGSLAQAQTSGVLPNQTAQAFTTQLDPTMSPKITALIQQLKHPQADKRIAAATQLGGMRESAQATVPYIIPLLQDPNPNVRISACQAFQKMQELASAAIPYLIPLLKDPNAEGKPKTMLVESTIANRDDKTINVPGMLNKETIDALINQLVPISSRGIKIKMPKVGSCIDFCYFPLGRYENVSIDLITQTVWQEMGQPFLPTRKDTIPKLMISWTKR